MISWNKQVTNVQVGFGAVIKYLAHSIFSHQRNRLIPPYTLLAMFYLKFNSLWDNLHYEKIGDGEPVCIEDEIPFEIPGGWEWVRLKSCLNFSNGTSKRHGATGTPTIVLRLADLGESTIEVTSPRRIPLTEKERNSNLLKAGDLIFVRVNGSKVNVGKCYQFFEQTEPVAICDHIIRGRSIAHYFKMGYLSLVLNAPQYKSLIFSMIVSAAGQHTISQVSLGSLIVPLPSHSEQQRIIQNSAYCEAAIYNTEDNQRQLESLAAQAKAKILDLAIHGKLVPQDPSDEPASVLLERIREEKERLITEGKIKRDKKESYIFRGDDNSYYEKIGDKEPICIEDEIPFEIPKSWEWARLKNVFTINPKNNAVGTILASFVPMAMIDGGYDSKFSFEILPWESIVRGFTHFAEGDVVFAKISPCFENRKSFIAEGLMNEIGAGTTELIVLRKYGETIHNRYTLYFLKSRFFIAAGIKTFMGTVGQQRVTKDYVAEQLFPLPPLIEQQRIFLLISRSIELIETTDL